MYAFWRDQEDGKNMNRLTQHQSQCSAGIPSCTAGAKHLEQPASPRLSSIHSSFRHLKYANQITHSRFWLETGGCGQMQIAREL